MPVTFMESLGMALRKTPVGRIRKALTKCENAGIAITAKELESHFLCGHDPVVLADALVAAKGLGVHTTCHEMSAICLAGHDPMALLLDASTDRVVTFDTYSPKRDERIVGFTRDQKEVSVTITAVYRLSPSQLAFRFDFRQIHERLGAAVSVFINTSPDINTLQLKKAEHEAQLALLVHDSLPGMRSVTLAYREK